MNNMAPGAGASKSQACCRNVGKQRQSPVGLCQAREVSGLAPGKVAAAPWKEGMRLREGSAFQEGERVCPHEAWP